MSYSFDFPDEEADKYEREVMDLYGPGQYKTIKGRTEAGVAEWVHDYCVHGWEEVGATFTRRANPFYGVCYCQMIKKIEEKEPEEEKPCYSSPISFEDVKEPHETCAVWKRVMEYHRPVSKYNKDELYEKIGFTKAKSKAKKQAEKSAKKASKTKKEAEPKAEKKASKTSKAKKAEA